MQQVDEKNPDSSRLWKYLELPQEFQRRASEIDLTAKQHIRIVERLAKHLARQRPKTPEEFERVEYLKDFCVKSATLNDQTISLLQYLHGMLQAITDDYKVFSEGARLNRIIRDQGERIETMMNERDEIENERNDLKRELLRRADTPNT